MFFISQPTSYLRNLYKWKKVYSQADPINLENELFIYPKIFKGNNTDAKLIPIHKKTKIICSILKNLEKNSSKPLFINKNFISTFRVIKFNFVRVRETLCTLQKQKMYSWGKPFNFHNYLRRKSIWIMKYPFP